jgi:hypothetical protein
MVRGSWASEACARSTREEKRTLRLAHRLERALQAVEHLVQQARTESRRQLGAGAGNGLANCQASRVFVNLHDRTFPLESHDLAHESGLADDDALIQLESGQVDADGRARNADDSTAHRLNLTW